MARGESERTRRGRKPLFWSGEDVTRFREESCGYSLAYYLLCSGLFFTGVYFGMFSPLLLLKRSISSLFCRAVLLFMAVTLAGLHAFAAITPVSYYRMGEDDPDPVVGANIQTLRNRFGIAHLSSSSSAGAGSFTNNVPPEAAARVGSSQAFALGDAYIYGAFLTATDNCGVEAWVKCSPATTTRNILYNGSSATNGYGIALVGGEFQAHIGSSYFGSAPVVPGAWTHVALVRSAGTATLYIDGVDCGSSTAPVTAPTGQLSVEGSPFLTGVDEVRTFTFSPGEFTPDDLLRRAAEVSIEQPAGTNLASGGTCDFGVLQPGESTTLDFTLSSSGVTDLSGIAASIVGPDADCFAITTSLPSMLATGGTTTFTVRFAPPAIGRRTAVLRLASNDPDESPYEIVLTGTTPGRELVVEAPTPTRLATGTVTVWCNTVPALRDVPPTLSGVTSLASNNGHVLARRSDGKVVAWGGPNYYGEATVPPGLPPVTAVAAGWNHSVAVTAAGTVVAWGRNNAGQTSVPEGLSNVIGVAAGREHSVACRADGTVVAWGTTLNGTTTVPEGLTGVIAVSAGDYHTVALKSDGTVVAWGRNTIGQTNVPAGLSGIVAVAAGGSHTLALRSNGTVVAWGYNIYGQASVPSGTAGVQSIAAGSYGSVALKSDGSLVGWGFLPNGFPTNATGIRAITISDQATAAVGDSTLDFGLQMSPYPIAKTITLRNTGTEPLHLSSVTLSGTGATSYSITAPMLPLELAPSGSVDLPVTFTPQGLNYRRATLQITSDDPVKEKFLVPLTGYGITAAPDIAIFEGDPADGRELADFFDTQTFPETAVNGQDTVKTFTIVNKGYLTLTGIKLSKSTGNRDDFLIGAPSVTSLEHGESTTFTVTFSPKSIGTRNSIVSVASNDGGENPFEIRVNGSAVGAEIAVLSPAGASLDAGKVTAWGVSLQSWHQQVPAGLVGEGSAAVGGSFALVLRHDGTVAGWGENGQGQTMPPEDLKEVISVAACYDTGFALKSDGTVVAWGNNTKGQATVPAGLSGVIKLVAARYHVMALKGDGTVVSWGELSPTGVPMPSDLTGVVDIATSPSSAVALKSDGNLVMWGDLNSNQTLVPAGLTGITRIVAGEEFVAVLKEDGTVTAWGGSVPSDNKFGAPSGLSDVVGIAARREEIMARKADGSLVIWGQYGYKPPVPAGLTGVSAMASYYPDYAAISVPVEKFGALPVSLSSQLRTFTIRNTGSLPLDIASVEMAGGHAGDFTVDVTGMPTSLPAGGQTTISVRFEPTAPGLRSSTLRISSSDRDEKFFDVLLTGDGVGTVPASPREAWRWVHFGAGANAGTAADDADPNGNGISNLLEYALGGSPVGIHPGPSGLPRCGTSETGHLKFEFTRDPSRSDIILVIQASDDLTTSWTDLARSISGAPFLSLVEGVTVNESETGSGSIKGVTLTDEATIVDPLKRRRFLRLLVTEP